MHGYDDPSSSTVKAGPMSRDAEADNRACTSPYGPKAHLGLLTANYLLTLPGNRGRYIEPQMIIDLLDPRPTWLVLCERLEHSGFKFDRDLLAQHLLHHMPHMYQMQPTFHGPGVPFEHRYGEVVNGAAQTTPLNFPSTLHARPRAGPLQTPTKVAWPPYYHDPRVQGFRPYQQTRIVPSSSLHLSTPSTAQSFGNMQMKRSEMMSNIANNNSDAVRKRQCSQIIDLTSSPDVEPDLKRLRCGSQVPQKLPSDDAARVNTSKTAQLTLSRNPTPALPPVAMSADQTQLHEIQLSSTAAPCGPRMHERSKTARPQDNKVVANISRNDARRRTSYSSRTIARDILLAAGTHPTMHRLNGHLDRLQEELDAVTETADLKTLNWDLIDCVNTAPAAPSQSKASELDAPDTADQNVVDHLPTSEP